MPGARRTARVVETDLYGLFFAFTVANLAGRNLAHASGSEAQAVARLDNLITSSSGNALKPRRNSSSSTSPWASASAGACISIRRRSRCWRAVRLAVQRYAAPSGPSWLATRQAALLGRPARVHSPGLSAALASARNTCRTVTGFSPWSPCSSGTDGRASGGAGGARTHDRRIMRSTATCIMRASCTATTEPCRRWP
jgi:hypothetical protein